MSERRMIIVDAEIARKIDENRGDMSHSDFIKFLIDSHLNGETARVNHNDYVKREEFEHFAQGIKEVVHHFLEFFLSYGLELGRQPQGKTFTELSQKLQALDARTKQ